MTSNTLEKFEARDFDPCTDQNAHAAILRHEQKQLVSAIRHAMGRGHKVVMCVMATGGGKTLTASYIASQAVARGKRVLILVHRARLMKQFSDALNRYELQHGLIAPSGWFDATQKVQVAKVGSMKNRMAKIDWRPDLVIVDEAHHCVEKTMFGAVVEHYDVHSLLLSATPWRLSGRGLGKGHGGYATGMVLGPDTAFLINKGNLAPYKLYSTPIPLDMSDAKIKGGDFSVAEIEERMKPAIVGNAVSHYAELARGKRAIVFTPSIATAEKVAADFRDAGFHFEAVHGELKEEEQDALVEKLDRHEIDGLVSVDLVSEGFDLPAIECAIFLRPTASLSLWVQMVGRVLRPSPGKEFAIILDHVGNYKLGLPDDKFEWSLEGQEKGNKAKPKGTVRQCLECFGVHRPAPECPYCGHVYEVKERAELEEVEGKLVEIESMRLRSEERKKMIAKCKTYEDFLAVANKLGYKESWARIRFDLRKNRSFFKYGVTQ